MLLLGLACCSPWGCKESDMTWQLNNNIISVLIFPSLHSVVSNSLRPHGQYPTRLCCPWDFPGKNTGVGCHFFLQGIFPTQGLNPGFRIADRRFTI